MAMKTYRNITGRKKASTEYKNKDNDVREKRRNGMRTKTNAVQNKMTSQANGRRGGKRGK